MVIPNWKGRKLLEKHLPEVMKAAGYVPNKILEVVVVDDASPDDSDEFLEESYPQIKIVRHKRNRGFSAAVNSGVRATKGELVCLLNVDVSPSYDFLVAVLPYFNAEKVFGVSLHEREYGYGLPKWEGGYIGVDMGKEGKRAHKSFYVNGGSGVFRKKIWEKLGGMDERLLSPFYWEDVDICYRAAKRGYEMWWEPRAKVVHEHGSVINPNFPAKKLTLIRERNWLLFNWKNLISKKLIKEHVLGVVRRSLKHPGYLRVVGMALLRLPVVLGKREREKKEEKVGDEEVLGME